VSEGGTELERRVAARIVWPAQPNRVPREVYTDPELFELELERIFRGPTWHCVAHEAELPQPGDFKTTWIGRVPMLVSRDGAGRVHVLVNVCIHRGAQVVRPRYGNAARSGFQCGYHLWTYELDGALRAAPLPHLLPTGFMEAGHRLPELRTEVLAGMVFGTFSERTPPLAEYLGDEDFRRAVREALWDGRLELLGSQRMVFHCNWKVYAENLSDGYHSRVLHAGARLLNGPSIHQRDRSSKDPSHGRYGHSWTRGHNVPPERHGELADESIVEVRAKPADASGYPKSNMALIFPSVVLSDNNDGLHLRFIRPLAVDRTQVEFTYFARVDEPDEVKRHRVRTGSSSYGPVGLITLEDGQAFGRVQRGAAAAREGSNSLLAGWEQRGAPGESTHAGGEARTVDFYTTYRRLMGLDRADGGERG
jgi:anthranilate 1,2-dioxygenase large subunit